MGKKSIKELRELKAWSLRDLAARSGITATSICHIETGKTANPKPSIKQKLSAAFNLPPESINW
jgi:transcriptional regulator with XRE-family HTH domain